jgi:YD repeat-containing protein
MAKRVAAAVALLAVATSCRSSHIEGTKVCRHYPIAFSQDGTAYACSFDGGHALLCNGPQVVQQWIYAGPEDFVLEPQVPNRILAQTRTVEFLGMVNTSRTFETFYRYDGAGRLIGRRRHEMDVTRDFDVEVVEYTAWDTVGRPTAGTIQSPDGTGPVTLTYDDAARRMDSSNGESVTQDVNGNVVRETTVFGFGPAGTSQYSITRTADFCL